MTTRADGDGRGSNTAQLARSAGLIGAATMGSRILGVARETVLAALFGAGTQMDAYNVAFRIPNLLRDLFAEGAMTAAFIPTFTRTLTQHGREQAWRLGNLVINALLLITGVLVILGIVFAEPLTRWLAPGYAQVPGKLELTGQLTRIMLPFLTTVAIAVATMGMLNSLGRFFIRRCRQRCSTWRIFSSAPALRAADAAPRSEIIPRSRSHTARRHRASCRGRRCAKKPRQPIVDFSDPGCAMCCG